MRPLNTKKILSVLFLFYLVNLQAQQYLSVNTTKSAEELVKDVFIGAQNASCITVSNVSVKGWQDLPNKPLSYGYFEKGTLPFDLEKGIILSTGDANKIPGPNNKLLDDADFDWKGDADLADALHESFSSYMNATSLEFEFIPHNTSEISFQYLFLSEEYRPNNCTYSDGFAFLIRKKGSNTQYTNIALVPGTQDPVTSLSINPSPACPKNIGYFGGFNTANNGINSPSAFDGQTKVLTAKATVEPGVAYEIKLVIADHLAGSDYTGRYDSAVFLKAGSFIGKKDLGADLIIGNNNPLCSGQYAQLDATTAGATSYQWYKDGNAIPGATQPKFNVFGAVNNAGLYEVKINLGGCLLQGSIQIDVVPDPTILPGPTLLCDVDFSGEIDVDFNWLSQQVIPDFHQNLIPKYYLNQTDANSGAPNYLNQPGITWKLKTDTKLYLRVESIFGCTPVIGETTLKLGPKIPLTNHNFITSEICNDNFAGVTVNLLTYQSEFTSDATVHIKFYPSLEDAKKGIPGTEISSLQTLDETHTFGLRFSGNNCPNVATLTVKIKQPKKSTTLENKRICPDEKVTLIAGEGNDFDSYSWSTGENTSSVEVSEGEYWVDLVSDGCVYRHFVSVTGAELPVINSVFVHGSTATVSVSGGNPPYQYSIDGGPFQSSPVFDSIPLGPHSISVIDENNCTEVSYPILVLNFINTITPKGDGMNDVLDFSDLKIKNDVAIKIFDRYGKLVFSSANNQYQWDGKAGGKTVSSGTYWYVLKWVEPDTGEPVVYTGWILVKNRN